MQKNRVQPTPKQNPNRKPTQPKQRNMPNTANAQYRTTDTIQRTMMSQGIMSGMNKNLTDYVHCRNNPFEGTGKAAIPDSGNSEFNVTDIVMYDNFTCPANSTTVIQTLPTFPCSAIVSNSSGTMTINGVTNTTTGGFTTTPNVTTQWAPMSVLPPYLSPYTTGSPQTPGQFGVDPYTIKTSRLVAAGYRLIYTGEAQTCSGTITVTPNDVGITETISNAAPSQTTPVGWNLNILDATEAIIIATPAGVPTLNLDWQVVPTAMTRASVTLRPEQGVLFLPRYKTGDFKLRPSVDTCYGVISNADTAVNTPTAYFNTIQANAATGSNPTYTGGVIWYDNDWTSAQLTLTGFQVNTPFRWETVWCFEVNPQIGSILSTMTRKAEKANPAAIETAQKMADTRPVATPLNRLPR